MSLIRFERFLALALVCVALTGCGSGLNLGVVRGQIKAAGKTVTHGTIMFHPEKGPTAVGVIQPDGSYTLTTLTPNDGALVGAHRVTIMATTVDPDSLETPKSLQEEIRQGQERDTGKVLVPGQVHWIVPQVNSRPETTTLQAEVKRGKNTIDFDVTVD